MYNSVRKFLHYNIKGKGETVMLDQEIMERRPNKVKTVFAAAFLALATITFVLTAVLGVASAGRIFFGGEIGRAHV